MFSCYLQRDMCCKECNRYEICFKSCLFQLECANCDYYKLKNKGEREMKEKRETKAIVEKDKLTLKVGVEFEPVEENLKIGVKRLHEDAVMPVFAHSTDSGFDLFTCEDIELSPSEKTIAKTGLAFELPKGWGVQIKNKSGITVKGCPSIVTEFKNATTEMRRDSGELYGYYGKMNETQVERRADITVFEGTVDMEYRGEIGIMIKNEEPYKITIPKHTKIAQGVLRRVYNCVFEEVVEFSNETTRGSGGFGSTGTTK